jgi:hypothetical protein
LKISNTNNIILNTIYNNALKQCLNGVKNWTYNVKILLENYGFADVFSKPNEININAFLVHFKQRVLNCFKQKWQADLNNNNVLNTLYIHLNRFKF